MKVSLLVNNFPPEIGSAADLFYQLSLGFESSGHIVNVFTTQPRYYNLGINLRKQQPKHTSRISKWTVEHMRPKINVYRGPLLPLLRLTRGKNTFLKELEHVIQPLVFLTMVDKIYSSDIVLTYSPPLILGYLSALIGKLKKVPTIINVQDMHPEAIIDLGLVKNSVLASLLKHLARQMYDNATVVTVHSRGNKELIIKKYGINPGKIFVIFNAVRVPPIAFSRERDFRKIYDLKGKFVVTYAGILSYSQDLDTIIRAARILLNKQKNIVFLIVGDGPKKEELTSLATALKLSDVIFIPFQDNENYWRLLYDSDICLVPLKKSKVKTPVVPRKLEEIMLVGKPVIANVPLEGDVPKLVQEANCGMAIESENPETLANTILWMYDLPKKTLIMYGENGRIYAEQNFSLKNIINKYEVLFASLKNNHDVD